MNGLLIDFNKLFNVLYKQEINFISFWIRIQNEMKKQSGESVNMKYRLAIDVGNSTSKSIIHSATARKSALKHKSVVAPMLTLPTFSEDDEVQAVTNVQNNLVVHITSPSIPVGLYAIGEKALKMDHKKNMNIRTGNKHEQDIPIIMPLATIAAKALQDHYKKHNEQPIELTVEVDYSTAIPAREFKPEIARALEARLIGEHIVVVYATSKPVKVNVSITKARVVQEGIPVVYAIVEGKEGLLSDYHKEYGEGTENAAYGKKKLLIVDIGDGTTEFVYINNGKPDTDLSAGERYGVGHAANAAKKLFDETVKANITMNRQQFMDAVLDETHHFHDDALNAMKMANVHQANEIAEFVQEMYLDRLAGNVEEIVVVGGGSATFKETLYPQLKKFTQSVGSRVLWIPAKYAPSLNAVGLDILNEKVFYKEPVEKE